MKAADNIEKSNGLTLVLGATGKTGHRIVERLERKGVPIRRASRGAIQAFDWNDQGNWPALLEGVTAAYICYAPDVAIPGAKESVRDFVTLAVARGVKRLVILTGRGEEEAQECEKIVQQSGVEWTVVRCAWFNQNFSEGEFLNMVLEGEIALPAAEVPEPFVDVEDIADVAAAALTEDGHAGQVYELTGPRLLTFAEVAEEISRASHRAVRFVSISHEAFLAGVEASGAPREFVWLLGYLFSIGLDGHNAHLSDGVQRALGREPRDFSDYARRIAQSGVWDVPEKGCRAKAS